MGVHEETVRIRLQEWQRIIEDRAGSGMTIAAYCQDRQLSKNAYYLRKLRESVHYVMHIRTTDSSFGISFMEYGLGCT